MSFWEVWNADWVNARFTDVVREYNVALDTASASVMGTDTSGTVTITTGTSSGAGVLEVVTFAKPFANPSKVILTPANDNAPGLQWGNAKTTTTFRIQSKSAPADNTEYVFDYLVVG